ncbi:ATP-binding protein [Robiginitomaculum antarcticum]|uniref:ATP-binding protein n=1 Tax=Robiginitomaculum antarcticum TaxID=437507 RepID=UPI00035E2F8D|nr:ATP-binding protein [Robiginitomaculum antarcticum]
MSIYETDQKPSERRRPAYVMWLCAIIALAAATAAALNAPLLGWLAFALLIGVAVIALIVMLALTIARPVAAKPAGKAIDQSLIAAALEKIKEPSLVTRDGHPVYANPAYMKLAEKLGVVGLSGTAPTIDRLLGSKIKSDDAAIFQLHHKRTETQNAEKRIDAIGRDGQLHRFRVQVSGLGRGQLWQIEDITGADFSNVQSLTHAPVGLFSVTAEGEILAINPILRRWLGLSADSMPELMAEFIENPGSLLDSPRSDGRIVRYDTRLITRKGLVTPAVLTGNWSTLDDGQAFASVAIYGHSSSPAAGGTTSPTLPRGNDDSAHSPMSGRAKSGAPFGVAALTGERIADATLSEINSALLNMSEADMHTGTAFAKLFDVSDTAPVFLNADFTPSDTQSYDAVLAGKKPRPVHVYFGRDAAHITAYIIDVSARKDLENQLVQSRKMQAVGQLAGGVAHDFNNLLTAIRLNTDELLGRHPVGDPSYPELQKINSTVTRAAGLVKKLLAFSRKQTLRTEVLDVTDALSDMYILLRQVMAERVKIDMRHGRNLPAIKADSTQIETVMVNLCVNARDALDGKSDGLIIISTHEAGNDALQKRGIETASGARFVRIDVTDNGTGMSAELQEKIFEPFFTTKAQGKGTGLGLATVYGIVEQSGGHLTVDSEPGKGTTFSVYLPATDEKPSADAPAAVASRASADKPSDLAGSGTVLFVEDEENVRTIAAKTLRKRGYVVIEAGDGEEAYEILESGDYKFDLMVSDVVMPAMDGPTLLRKGRALLGDAKIVFISGYAEEEFSDILSEHPDITFLPKPFTLLELAQRVKRELADED